MMPSAQCSTMDELRQQIDRLDDQLVLLLAKRAEYIQRAADLKRSNGMPARIDDRIEQVVNRAMANAARAGLDPQLAETLWRALIEWSIQHEETALGRQ